MIRFALASMMTLTVVLWSGPSHAQLFASYRCDDGTQISAVFFPSENNMRMQMSGRTYSLPQRLSADGGRYARGGVSFWVKGQQATLKRPRVKSTVCRVQ